MKVLVPAVNSYLLLHEEGAVRLRVGQNRSAVQLLREDRIPFGEGDSDQTGLVTLIAVDFVTGL